MNNRYKPVKQRAVVIGGSMSGLFAATVLSEFYENVTVVERDDLATESGWRRGTPQGRHAHGLLASGLGVLAKLCPEIRSDLEAAGAMPADTLNDARWFFEGGVLCRVPSGTTGLLVSRPVLEKVFRKHVRKTFGVEFAENSSVMELLHDGDRVIGVRTAHREIKSDLVVDATGRGSHASEWLKTMQFAAPREEKVEVKLAYTTRLFKRRDDDLGGDKIIAIPPTPEGKRGGVMLAQENGLWIVTLFGHFGNKAPQELGGFIDYAKTLPAPFIYEVIRRAEPVGEASFIRFPTSTRRRYEELDRFPEGFIVFGDAICSFNPIYGQGMSVAALQALELRDELAKGREQIAKRFFNRAARVIDNPWNIAVGGDLRMPETNGDRATAVKLINWYLAKLHKCAHTDPKVSVAFMHVAQLLATPDSLMRPSIAWRVLAAGFRRPAKEAVAESSASHEVVI